MRKIMIIFMILTALLLPLTSCVPEIQKPPPGVWMSEEPSIMLYLTPEYQFPVREGFYPGLFMKDGIGPKVLVTFPVGRSMNIYDIGGGGGVPNTGGGFGSGIYFYGLLLAGSFRILGEEMHYRPTPTFQERLGVSEIIFRLVEDYDPINPSYWPLEFFTSEN